MARISDFRKKDGENKKIKSLAALMIMLDALDAFSLTKGDKGVSLTACINLLEHSFFGKNIYDLTSPLGSWLCAIPKGIWEEKKRCSHEQV